MAPSRLAEQRVHEEHIRRGICAPHRAIEIESTALEFGVEADAELQLIDVSFIDAPLCFSNER